MKNVLIIGAGAWGTALAMAFFRAENQVTIWSMSLDEAETINQRQENVFRLPGIPLDPQIKATTDKKIARKSDIIIFAPPAQELRNACKKFRPLIAEDIPLICVSKGIENRTRLLMTQVMNEFFPNNPKGVLSGPSFAEDVARKFPTAVNLAFDDIKIGQELSDLLSSSHFQLHPSDDVIGTQIGGACKNIIALSAGIVLGRELGENTRAALLTQGLQEMALLGQAMGAKLKTFLDLSGVGDLALSSFSEQSRNMAFGLALGRGTPLNELLLNKKSLTEGIYTVKAVTKLAQDYNVDMPLTFSIYKLLQQKITITDFIDGILTNNYASS